MFEHNKGQDTLPSCSVSGTQSHEGCRKDLFKTSQKKGCWISAAHHCLSPFSVGLCLQSTTHAPTCQQCHGSATGFLNYLHTSPIIIFHPQRKTSNPAQDQPDGRKSSVDAHAVSSYLGCSRILRHLISFLNIITGLPTWKKNMYKEYPATPHNKASQDCAQNP